jgi:hypothetical protein
VNTSSAARPLIWITIAVESRIALQIFDRQLRRLCGIAFPRSAGLRFELFVLSGRVADPLVLEFRGGPSLTVFQGWGLSAWILARPLDFQSAERTTLNVHNSFLQLAKGFVL